MVGVDHGRPAPAKILGDARVSRGRTLPKGRHRAQGPDLDAVTPRGGRRETEVSTNVNVCVLS